MSTPFQQRAIGPMTYPGKRTLNRLLFKTPLIWWRMGLGPILGQVMLVLSTWGRKSKLPRYTMLSYTICNNRAYLLSGWGDRTDWYRNVLDNSHVTVQREAHPYSAVARRVSDRLIIHCRLAVGATGAQPQVEQIGNLLQERQLVSLFPPGR